ncbi:Usually multiple acids move in and out Transporters 40 [Hibiscus trionum]|uniref:WAT1-related protein n=1 Tax=Hibiscus trionum TaxID=183268 RepID=A0A9W7M315_HIBTR|nr:Usually multiple acids move in and out Transporters 40 [Hibiscus trionum]GMI87794.1 Usually multiple acids move in and out Transporters 40 [Hibiscus trionum]GMI87797.1 Usually multiple acids move in and out Transporters 40 [Hibiscus trionum]
MGNLLVFVGMIMVILAQVSSMEITKAAMSSGVNKYVLIVYSNLLSSLVLLPCSFLFHGSVRLPWSSSNLYRFIFLLSLLGCIGQLCGYAGMDYSSPAMATAMLNLIPAFTFILVIICRMEKLEWRSASSQAKVLGTIISITGAFVITFYKGPTILRLSHQLLFSSQLQWVLGGLLLAIEAFMTSAWYIIQAMVLKKFPAVLTVMFYLCFFNAALSSIYSLILVRDTNAWKLRPGIGLIAVLYSGIVATTFRISLFSWCLWKAGPLYVSMFKPLAIVVATAIGIVFLGEDLSLGRVIGAIIIVSGFYGVMWGKAKEESFGSSNQKVSLLQDSADDKSSSV